MTWNSMQGRMVSLALMLFFVSSAEAQSDQSQGVQINGSSHFSIHQRNYFQTPRRPAYPTTATLKICVPDDAVVCINGYRTKPQTPIDGWRRFTLTELVPGRPKWAKIEAKWDRDGIKIDRTDLIVKAGGFYHWIAIAEPAPSEPAPSEPAPSEPAPSEPA
ncbi:MAG: hypothetical protein ABJZ79_18680, partial [Parasphingorhabdus sp.]|uniref:hypothetical protein n=1 Tax=Parasphingorhabdus sp. TaxID=2709688 RepID=UPI0032989EC4